MSGRLRFRPKIVVALRSPFIMGGVDASGVGVDTPALRDELGDPILPGDHLKGLVREAFLALAVPTAEADRLLGAKSAHEKAQEGGVPPPPGDSNAPQRGRLRLRDLVAREMVLPTVANADSFETGRKRIADWRDTARREGGGGEGRPDITRIRIDPNTGAVERGMLQVVELAAPIGAAALFEGEALFYGDADEAKAAEALLRKALAVIPYFGALRSVGFGEPILELCRVDFGAGAPILTPPTTPMLGATFEGEFDAAFLVSATRLADNVYEGAGVIPGAALKGALADMLEAAGRNPAGDTSIGRALTAIRISHAWPLHVIRDEREGVLVARRDTKGEVAIWEAGRPLPLSLMRDQKTGAFACALNHPTPGVMSGVRADFQPDWKGAWFDAARLRAQRPEVALDVVSRGHTAIDRDGGGAATGQLFVEALRGRLHDDRPSIEAATPPCDRACRFRFRVDLPPDATEWPEEDQRAAQEIFATLSKGLDAVGKTNSVFSTRAAASATSRKIDASRARWTVMLETDGVLIDTGDDVIDAGAALAAYWAHVAPGAELKRRFVRRRLVGGYLGMRRRVGATYRPWSLFSAGSVFEIETAKGGAPAVAAALEHYQVYGLPALRCEAGALRSFADWRRCPFLPQNGYGEISVDAPLFDEFNGGAA